MCLLSCVIERLMSVSAHQYCTVNQAYTDRSPWGADQLRTARTTEAPGQPYSCLTLLGSTNRVVLVFKSNFFTGVKVIV